MYQWLQHFIGLQKHHAHATEALSITVDDLGVQRMARDGVVERILWAELEEVGIKTTAAGPYFEDFFLVLHGQHATGCVVPLQPAIQIGLIERLQALPNFDHQQLIQASLDIREAYYICWQKGR